MFILLFVCTNFNAWKLVFNKSWTGCSATHYPALFFLLLLFSKITHQNAWFVEINRRTLNDDVIVYVFRFAFYFIRTNNRLFLLLFGYVSLSESDLPIYSLYGFEQSFRPYEVFRHKKKIGGSYSSRLSLSSLRF